MDQPHEFTRQTKQIPKHYRREKVAAVSGYRELLMTGERSNSEMDSAAKGRSLRIKGFYSLGAETCWEMPNKLIVWF